MRTRIVVIAAVVGLLLLVGAGAVYAYDRAHAEEIGEGRARRRRRRERPDRGGGAREAASAPCSTRSSEPGRRPRDRQALHAHARARAGRRGHRRLGARRAGAHARRQHARAHLARDPRRAGRRGARARHQLLQGRGRAPRRRASRKAVDEPRRRRRRRPRERRPDAAAVRGRPPAAGQAPRAPGRSGGCSPSATVKTVPRRPQVVKPKVTTDELAEKYPAILVVDRANFQLTLYKDLKLAKTYGIAVGQVGLETPAGLYHIQNKAVDPAWTMPNSSWVAPATRGTVIPGGIAREPAQGALAGHLRRRRDPRHRRRRPRSARAASHGCVRMRIPDVIELYDQVPVGAPIYIA